MSTKSLAYLFAASVVIFCQNAFSSGNSFSGLPWGFGECCVTPCGTIPCDDQCAGKALDNFGDDTKGAEGDLKDAYSNLGDGTVNALDISLNNILKGWDARTRILQIEETKNAINMVNLAQAENTNDVNAFQAMVNSTRVLQTDLTLNARTYVGQFETSLRNQPEILDVVSTSSSVFKGIFQKIQAFQVEYKKNRDEGGSGATRQQVLKEALNANISYTEFGGITQADYKKNIYPSLILFDALARQHTAGLQPLEMLIEDARTDINTYQLAYQVSGDVQVPVVIPSIYSNTSVVSPEGTSLNQYLNQDPMMQPDWFQAVKLMSEADLNREMIMQDVQAAAIELQLLNSQSNRGLTFARSN